IAAEVSNSSPALVNSPILLVISPKLYIVLSAYEFSSFNVLLTSARVVPCLAVLASIVWTDAIFDSYSWNPSVIGFIDNELAMFIAALVTLFDMLDNTLLAICPIVENLALTVSIALLREPMSMVFTLLVNASVVFNVVLKVELVLPPPLENASFNFWNTLVDSDAFLTKSELSILRRTNSSSIGLAIIYSTPLGDTY